MPMAPITYQFAVVEYSPTNGPLFLQHGADPTYVGWCATAVWSVFVDPADSTLPDVAVDAVGPAVVAVAVAADQIAPEQVTAIKDYNSG